MRVDRKGAFLVLLAAALLTCLWLGWRYALRPATITVGNETFRVRIAATEASHRRGLGGTASLPADQGMLFVFPTANTYGFWMKDMRFPLDFVWIADGRVVDLTENVPAPRRGDELSLYRPSVPALQVLEVGAGEVGRRRIRIGDPVRIGGD